MNTFSLSLSLSLTLSHSLSLPLSPPGVVGPESDWFLGVSSPSTASSPSLSADPTWTLSRGISRE